eukprot:4394364-Prymnesium_polylepis.2
MLWEDRKPQMRTFKRSLLGSDLMPSTHRARVLRTIQLVKGIQATTQVHLSSARSLLNFI